MKMLLSARVLLREQCAIVLLTAVVIESRMLRDRSDYQQQREIENNEVLPPPLNFDKPETVDVVSTTDMKWDKATDRNSIDDTVGPKLAFGIMRVSKVREPTMPADEHGHKDEPVPEDPKSSKKSGSTTEPSNAVESWCVIWYLGAFGSLVCFFLVITCTELFFGNPLYRDSNLNAFVQGIASGENKSYVPETPPPPYHLFAPPDYYETIQKTESAKRASLDLFVVPVHAAAKCRPEPPPPPRFDEATADVAAAGKSNPAV